MWNDFQEFKYLCTHVCTSTWVILACAYVQHRQDTNQKMKWQPTNSLLSDYKKLFTLHENNK